MYIVCWAFFQHVITAITIVFIDNTLCMAIYAFPPFNKQLRQTFFHCMYVCVLFPNVFFMVSTQPLLAPNSYSAFIFFFVLSTFIQLILSTNLWSASNGKYFLQSANKLHSHALVVCVAKNEFTRQCYVVSVCVCFCEYIQYTENSVSEKKMKLYNCRLVDGVRLRVEWNKIFFFCRAVLFFCVCLFIHLVCLFCLSLSPLPVPFLLLPLFWSSLHFTWLILNHRRIKCDIEYLFMWISEVLYVCV